MRLVRIGERGSERAGVLSSDQDFYDLSSLGDFSEEFFSKNSRQDIQKRLRKLVDQGLKPEKIGNQRWGAPIARPHQIICIGLNYADHAQETGAEIPSEPIIFTKSPNTLIGPYDNVHIPVKSEKTDWEVELAIVIGKQCRYLKSEEAALESIFGYMISNDISEREFQLEREGQWSKGKSSETFNPAGPWLLTADEVPDPTKLGMGLRVNGELMQNSSTSQMVFQPSFLVQYLSQFMVLEPGDIINTGTPPGVGMGLTPQRFLRPGDKMELQIDLLGKQEQRVISAP